MNILIINHYAGSPDMGMEYRPYYLAKEWIKKGHKVKIIAASFSHLRNKNPEVKNSYTEQNIEGIDYLWIKTPEYKGNSTKRFINMLIFVDKLSHKAGYIAKTFKPDVVIASSTYPLDIFPAKRIAKKSNAKLIFEIHDLWPLSPMELGGYSKYHPFIIIMQFAENFAYKKSDYVISILPKTLEHTIKHGLNPEKWHHVPNGIVLEDWDKTLEIPDNHKNILSKLKSEDKKIIGYAGGHAISNALTTLVNASILMIENEEFAFVLVGDGIEKQHLIKLSEGNKNIFFLPPVNKQGIPELLSYFDFLYIGWNKSPLYRFGISPNKIFDYMMTAKPIIHSVEAGNDIVKEAACGISVEPENPEKVADAILKLAKLSEKELSEMGKRGKQFVLKKHEYGVLAENFLELIK